MLHSSREFPVVTFCVLFLFFFPGQLLDGAVGLLVDSPDPHCRWQHGRPGRLEHVQRAQVTHELFHQTPRHRR